MAAIVQRIPSLDGARTISIALVIVGHLLHVLGVGQTGNLGNLGVRVFFVISGFLITGLLVKELNATSKIDLLKFYYRRSLRIFPPFYFYILVIFAAGQLGFVSVSAFSLVVSSAYLTDYINPGNWLFGHTWSLAVEEQFYLFLPGLLLLAPLQRIRYFLIFVVLVAPIVRVLDYQFSGDAFWVLKGFHSNMDALAIGCLLSLFRTELHDNAIYQKVLSSKAVFLLIPAIVFFNIQTDHPIIFYGVSLSFMNIAIGLLLDWCVTNHESKIGVVLNSRPMVVIGMMSYSIYLWQQPFLDPTSQSWITTFPFNLIGIVAMTLLSYYVVEKWSLKMRQIWEPKLFGKKRIPIDNAEPVRVT